MTSQQDIPTSSPSLSPQRAVLSRHPTPSSSYRLGIDIGGTFTDAILWDDAAGTARIAKVPSTPHDPSQGFLEATLTILRDAGVPPDRLPAIVHGTTVATNAIIEGRTPPAAFVTTEGFRDMLEIARQTRPSLYDLQFQKPRPLVPRDRCFQVPERLDARGQVVQPLDASAVRAVAETLRTYWVAAPTPSMGHGQSAPAEANLEPSAADGQQVQSVAVCFLHAYLNPEHERRAGAILREVLPGVSISLSSEVAPEVREYVRASTTVVNAAVRPVVERYLRAIEASLAEHGIHATLLVMQSNGGVMTAESAVERPVFMVESGPAAGVVAATYLAERARVGDVVSFDMGGTTAKAGLVRDGRPTVTKDYEVGAQAAAGTGAARGSGYPIRTPVIDLVEIGAGGGSIAWVDSGGVLRVGPRSAGADPGPVCYRRGGTEPTVTDANLVLGRINPHNFLGGALALGVEAARVAIEERCAKPLGMGVVEAAHGIVEIANAAMTNAIHLVSVQRGYDPRELSMVAFGGAGPLHANRLAAELHVPTTVIPASPGTFSALGLLATDLTHDYSRTLRQRTANLDLARANQAFAEMAAEGRAVLEREGVTVEQVVFRRALEVRYVGQSFELLIPLDEGMSDDEPPSNGHTTAVPGRESGAGAGISTVPERADPAVTASSLAAAIAAFHRAHERAYGFAAEHEPTEVVNLRLTAVGAMPRPTLAPRRDASAGPAQTGTRPVYFAEAGGYVDCAVIDRYRLAAGDTIHGPAIVEELDSTTCLHPGYHAAVDPFGNLLIRASAVVASGAAARAGALALAGGLGAAQRPQHQESSPPSEAGGGRGEGTTHA